jgi:Ca2+/Na+ antiporter
VRDILVYTLAVAFLLYVLDSQRVTPAYVALSFFAYVCYVLAVLTADFHHRGWLPGQTLSRTRSRRSGRDWTARLIARAAPRRRARSPSAAAAGRVSKVKAAPKGSRAPVVLLASGEYAAEDAVQAALAGTDARQAQGAASGALSSPVAVSSAQTRDTVLALPVSQSLTSLQDGGSEGGVTRTFTRLSIENVRTAPMSTAGTPWPQAALESALAAVALLSAPLRTAQTWSIPCGDQHLHTPAASPHAATPSTAAASPPPELSVALVVKSFLACQVQALYFRKRLSVRAYLWFTAASAIAVLLVWALTAALAHSGSGFELAHCGHRATRDPDDQMAVIEEARSHEATPSASASPLSSTIPAEPSTLGIDAAAGASLEQPAVFAAAMEPLEGGDSLVSHDSAAWSPASPPATPVASLPRRLHQATTAGLNVAAFVASILWIQLIAEELVALLDFLGAVLSVDHTLLGITLLAWGAHLLLHRLLSVVEPPAASDDAQFASCAL